MIDEPVHKPKPIVDVPVNKEISWKNGEIRANRLAGRPQKDLAPIEKAKTSQLVIYSRIAQYQEQIYENLNFYLSHKNERLRLDVTMYLFDKLLPNAKAQELAERNAPITVNFVKAGYIPPDTDASSPVGSNERPTPLQSVSVAPESEEDNDGNNGSREAGNNEEGGVLASVSNIR